MLVEMEAKLLKVSLVRDRFPGLTHGCSGLLESLSLFHRVIHGNQLVCEQLLVAGEYELVGGVNLATGSL